jgi:hypothetical protein
MVVRLLAGDAWWRWVSKWGAPEWRACECGMPFACGAREARENCYGCEESMRRIFGENDPAGRVAAPSEPTQVGAIVGKPVDGGEGV